MGVIAAMKIKQMRGEYKQKGNVNTSQREHAYVNVYAVSGENTQNEELSSANKSPQGTYEKIHKAAASQQNENRKTYQELKV